MVVGAHGEDDVAPLVPAVDDLQERVAGALAVDVLGHGVVAAGHGATGVTVVALDGGHQEELPVVVEHRGEDIEVRQVAPAVVRVVGDDDVAGLQLVAEEVDGEADREGAREHELRNPHRERGQAALAVEDGGVAFIGLVEDGCRRRARHVGRHLEADGLDRRSDDLGGDEVDLDGLWHVPPSGGLNEGEGYLSGPIPIASRTRIGPPSAGDGRAWVGGNKGRYTDVEPTGERE